MLDTMVIGAEKDKTLYAVNPEYGFMVIKAKAVILAMMQERPRGALRIPFQLCVCLPRNGTAICNIEGILQGL